MSNEVKLIVVADIYDQDDLRAKLEIYNSEHYLDYEFPYIEFSVASKSTYNETLGEWISHTFELAQDKLLEMECFFENLNISVKVDTRLHIITSEQQEVEDAEVLNTLADCKRYSNAKLRKQRHT